MASKFGLAGGIPERKVRPIWDAIDSRQFKNALKHVTTLLAKHPNSPYALALKALVLERMGKPEEAFSVSLNAKELLYGNDSLLMDDLTLSTLQIVFQRLDHLDLATECYEHACAKFSNNLELVMGLFNCYVREYSFVKQQQTAIKMYKLAGEERFLLWAVCSIQLQKFVEWSPAHDYQIRQIFKSKGSKRLSMLLMGPRRANKRPKWIGQEAWNKLKVEWEKPEYKEKSMKAKQNRASAKGGSVHTGGSISTLEIARRMAIKLGREPTVDEIFLETHQKKIDKSWVDNRSQQTYEKFQDKLSQASQGETSGSKDVDPTTRLEIWAETAGGKSRGRLYGTADMACNYRKGVSSLNGESRESAESYGFPSHYPPEMAAQLAAAIEEAKMAAQHAVQEALKEADERTQEAVRVAEEARERASDFERQLKALATTVATIEARNASGPSRHRDYIESEESREFDDSEDSEDSD